MASLSAASDPLFAGRIDGAQKSKSMLNLGILFRTKPAIPDLQLQIAGKTAVSKDNVIHQEHAYVERR